MTATPPSPSLKAPITSSENYRVMVVDDSAIIRGLITHSCESAQGIQVANSVANGQEAVKALEQAAVDVIILDIDMPIMDGLTAIPLLKSIDPAVQIVMTSTLNFKSAEISLKALALGATDYVSKPTSTADLSVAAEFTEELVNKILLLGAVARSKGVRQAPSATPARAKPHVAAAAAKKFSLRSTPVHRPDIIAIGASTGGPQALHEVVKGMGPNLSQPVVITQHMPPTFTTILADHLARQCRVHCREAKEGEVLQAGHYYIAPGDFHLTIVETSEGSTVKLNKDPPENFCRPAVDPMIRSLIPIYGKRILAVILTGMGQDGYKACQLVSKAGGSIVAQDEASSVVWGMPAAVASGGLCFSVLPLKEIGPLVKTIALRPHNETGRLRSLRFAC